MLNHRISRKPSLLEKEVDKARKLLDFIDDDKVSGEEITQQLNNFKKNAKVDIQMERILSLALAKAIPAKKLNLIRGILDSHYQIDLSKRTEENYSLLSSAILNYHSLDTIEYLIKKGAQVNENNSFMGLTPLHMACINKDFELINLLLRRNANINAVDDFGYPVTAGICSHGSLSGLQEFVNHIKTNFGMDIDFREHPHALILNYACKTNDIESIIWLLDEKKVDVNQADLFDLTPLHYAVSNASDKLVAFLLGRGANVNSIDKSHGTPFTAALEYASTKIQKLLLAHPSFNIATSGKPYLHLAITTSDMEVVRKLVEVHGANINEQDNEDGMSPLCIAISVGNFKAAKYLINLGVELKTRDNFEHDALYYAILAGSASLITLLIDKLTEALSLQDKKSFIEKSLETAKHNDKRRSIDCLYGLMRDINQALDEVKRNEQTKGKEKERPIKEESPTVSVQINKSQKRKRRAKAKKEKLAMIGKVEEAQKISWLNGRISPDHLLALENHDGYRVCIAKSCLEGQAGKLSETLDNLLNLPRWKICRKKGVPGIKMFDPHTLVDLYIDGKLVGTFPIYYEIKKPREKARVYGVEIVSDDNSGTKLILFCKFDPKGLHNGNTLSKSLVINLSSEDLVSFNYKEKEEPRSAVARRTL